MAAAIRTVMLVGFFIVQGTARADQWEVGTYSVYDDSAATTNVLWPGMPPQRHDLANVGGVADQDWMRINVHPYRSYEVAIFHSNLDFFSTTTPLQRFNSSGETLLQTGAYPDLGQYRRSLNWIEATGTASTQMIKVPGVANFNSDDFYEIGMRETTLYCPRFNNSGTQVSVLIVQRAAATAESSCTGTAYFYNESETLVGTQAMSFASANGMKVVPLPGVPGLAGEKGSARIAHTCGMGGIKGKFVALEPATGFSFDTSCTPRDN